MGYDTGIDPDASGTSAACIFHEYPAKCKPDKDRFVCSGGNDSGNHFECGILYLYESRGKWIQHFPEQEVIHKLGLIN